MAYAIFAGDRHHSEAYWQGALDLVDGRPCRDADMASWYTLVHTRRHPCTED